MNACDSVLDSGERPTLTAELRRSLRLAISKARLTRLAQAAEEEEAHTNGGLTKEEAVQILLERHRLPEEQERNEDFLDGSAYLDHLISRLSGRARVDLFRGPLSRAQFAVLMELPSGDSGPVIARRLGVCSASVYSRIAQILDRLDARDRSDAVRIANWTGLIDDRPSTRLGLPR